MNHFAVALILPEEVGQILNNLRGKYAGHMKYIDIPHVSLAYPFAPKVDIVLVAEKLKLVAEETKLFRLALNGIRYFEGESKVAYLTVLNPKPVIELHYAISRAISDLTIDDYGSKFSFSNFVPHVTIGIDIPANMLTEVKESLSKYMPCYECWINKYGLLEEDDTGTWRVVERFTLAG